MEANFPLISNKASCLSCLLVRSEMLGLFFNALTADHMYSCHIRHRFQQQGPTHLSSKEKLFSGVVILFLKSTENFEIFEEEDHLHTFNIFRVIDSEICGSLNAPMILFQNTLWKVTC